MINDHNFATDTNLFHIRLNNIYWGEVLAADSASALDKAQKRNPKHPKELFKVEFSHSIYPAKVMLISDVLKVLDENNVPYEDPVGNKHQIILQEKSDILEGGYGMGDEPWDFFIRSTKTTSAKTLHFKNSEELTAILRAYYIH